MSAHTLFEAMDNQFPLNGCIVEIGSARESAGIESSTFYFRELSMKKNIEFYSVDFSEASYTIARELIGDFAVLCDGRAFIEKFQSISKIKISILYLDNFDIIYNETHEKSLRSRVGNVYSQNKEEITNERSAQVHLEQVRAAVDFNVLCKDNIIIIDDTMLREGVWWGKGALAVPFLMDLGYTIKAQSEDGVLLVCPENK